MELLRKVKATLETLLTLALLALLIYALKTKKIYEWISFINTLPLPVLIIATIVGLIALALFMR